MHMIMCSTLPPAEDKHLCKRTLLSILKENIEIAFGMNLMRLQASNTAYYCHPADYIYSWTLLPYSYRQCQVGLTTCDLNVTLINHYRNISILNSFLQVISCVSNLSRESFERKYYNFNKYP